MVLGLSWVAVAGCLVVEIDQDRAILTGLDLSEDRRWQR
jgi:hypothetical protein